MIKSSAILESLRSKLVPLSLGLGFTIAVLSTILYGAGFTQTVNDHIDDFIYDFVTQHYPRPYKEITKVFIVDIDDESLLKEGRWPWPRKKLAQIISNLQHAGVVCVGVDIIMSNPEINYATALTEQLESIKLTSNPTNAQLKPTLFRDMLQKIAPEVDNDKALADAMKSYDVSLGFLFHNIESLKIGTLPTPLQDKNGAYINSQVFNAHSFHGYNASLDLFIKASGHGGYVSNLPDLDGVIRHGLVLASYDNKIYPNLALRTAMRFLLADYVELKKHKTFFGEKLYGLDLAGTFIPTNERGEILIPYWGPPFTLPYVSASNVLHGNFDSSQYAGAVAILGSSSLLLSDIHPAPVAQLFPGVEMVGNMVSGIISQQLLTPYDWQSIQGLGIMIGVGVVYALVATYLSVFALIFSAISLCCIIVGCSLYFLLYKHIHIPVSYLVILITMQATLNYSYQFLLVKRQKTKIKRLFGQYVPEGYINELINLPGASSMEGQTRELSVLFSDIRGFTDICEGLDAGEVKRLLNAFFTPITEIIFNHHGTIDKYVGDMIIAFWGAPIPIENNGHSRLAIKTALDIFKNLPIINEQMIKDNLPPIRIGIGLGTGIMNVGDMGSKFRLSYTVLGDTVNLTSRLESLTKHYGVNILVNDYMREGQHEFLWRTIDKVLVKGRKTALTIYEPLGLIQEATPELISELEHYHLALESYFAQDWDEAERLLDLLHNMHPQTQLYQLYLTRIRSYKTMPPPLNWDGIYAHLEK